MPITKATHQDRSEFIVFGCRPSDELLVELHTDSFQNAVSMRALYSCTDFKARVFNTRDGKFVKDTVLDHAEYYYLH